MDSVKEAAEAFVRLVLSSKSTVALTGAGISTESGIPDYRSPGTGLWEKMDQSVVSLEGFRRAPHRYYDYALELYPVRKSARPNPAHLYARRARKERAPQGCNYAERGRAPPGRGVGRGPRAPRLAEAGRMPRLQRARAHGSRDGPGHFRREPPAVQGMRRGPQAERRLLRGVAPARALAEITRARPREPISSSQ